MEPRTVAGVAEPNAQDCGAVVFFKLPAEDGVLQPSPEPQRQRASSSGSTSTTTSRRADVGSTSDRRRRPSVVAHALSGTLGSLLAEVLLFPVDTVKLQVQTSSARSKLGFGGTLFAIVRAQGVRGLYAGVGGSLVKESVHSFNFWLFHGVIFRICSRYEDTSDTPPMKRLLLNLVAKQLNWLCTVPFEVVSSVNQLSEGSPGLFRTAQRLHAEGGGIGVFYRGLSISLMLAINPAIMGTLITTLLTLLVTARRALGAGRAGAAVHSSASVGLATGIAKAIATLLTYPLIRVKVLQQTRGGDQSVASVLRRTLRTEGVLGLYRGVLAMSYKTVLWNSLMMVFKHLLGPKRSTITHCNQLEQQSELSATRMPTLGREPFAAEMLTPEVIDEVLEKLRLGGSDRRVEALERRLDEVQRDARQQLDEVLGELRAVRRLLASIPESRISS